MKVHVGVVAESGLLHSVQTTSANVHDLTPAAELLHGEETVVYADAVTVREDDAPAAHQVAFANVAAFGVFSAGGGLIHTTSG